jgi:hypothetical protein
MKYHNHVVGQSDRNWRKRLASLASAELDDLRVVLIGLGVLALHAAGACAPSLHGVAGPPPPPPESARVKPRPLARPACGRRTRDRIANSCRRCGGCFRFQSGCCCCFCCGAGGSIQIGSGRGAGQARAAHSLISISKLNASISFRGRHDWRRATRPPPTRPSRLLDFASLFLSFARPLSPIDVLALDKRERARTSETTAAATTTKPEIGCKKG